MGMIDLAEKKWFPDSLIRIGIRQLLKQRLKDESAFEPDKLSQRKQHCIEQLKRSPIAIETQAANEQHYEVPAEFYKEVLGKRFKYSGCYWTNSCLTLDDAEEAMLVYAYLFIFQHVFFQNLKMVVIAIFATIGGIKPTAIIFSFSSFRPY